MEFGTKSRFGISVDFDHNSSGPWFFGKFCYWIGGNQIGQYEQGTSISDVLFQSKWINKDNDSGRYYSQFCKMPDREVFDQIDSSLFGLSKNRNVLPEEASPAKFNISIPVDIFDEWKIFLLDCEFYSKVLLMNCSDKEFRSFLLKPREFEDVFSSAYKYIEKIVDGQN